MKNKLIPIIIAAVVVVALVAGIVLANVIGKGGDDSSLLGSSIPETSVGTSTAQDDSSELENLLPDDVTAPEVGGDIEPPDLDIDPDANFDDGNFYMYFLDFSLFFHDELKGVEDLRKISGYNWLTAAYVANYVYAADIGQGITYETDATGHLLIPITRLSQGCEEIFGFPYDFAELAAGDFSSMVVDGKFAVPDGYDINAPYADLTTAKLSVKGSTITVDVTVVEMDYDNDNPPAYGNFRYTFTLDDSQLTTPYRLVSIQAI